MEQNSSLYTVNQVQQNGPVQVETIRAETRKSLVKLDCKKELKSVKHLSSFILIIALAATVIVGYDEFRAIQTEQRDILQNIQNILIINNKQNNQTSLRINQYLQKKQSKALEVVYIWQGPLPQRHIKKLRDFKYPFRLVRNCDMYLKRMENQISQKFSDFIYQKVNQKTDTCKFVYLYYEGGLYLDLDTHLDYNCFQNYLDKKSKSQNLSDTVFFERNNKTKGIDFFGIYTEKPFNHNLKNALKYQNTFRSFSRFHSTLVSKFDKEVMLVQTTGCIQHFSEGSWKQK